MLIETRSSGAAAGRIDATGKPALLLFVKLRSTVQLWQEGDQFVGHAMPLDVVSSGPTPHKARKALKEALTLFLETARDAGSLRQVLGVN